MTPTQEQAIRDRLAEYNPAGDTDVSLLLDALDEARATLKLVYKGSEDAICAMAKENAELRQQLKEKEATV